MMSGPKQEGQQYSLDALKKSPDRRFDINDFASRHSDLFMQFEEEFDDEWTDEDAGVTIPKPGVIPKPIVQGEDSFFPGSVFHPVGKAEKAEHMDPEAAGQIKLGTNFSGLRHGEYATRTEQLEQVQDAFEEWGDLEVVPTTGGSVGPHLVRFKVMQDGAMVGEVYHDGEEFWVYFGEEGIPVGDNPTGIRDAVAAHVVEGHKMMPWNDGNEEEEEEEEEEEWARKNSKYDGRRRHKRSA